MTVDVEGHGLARCTQAQWPGVLWGPGRGEKDCSCGCS
jgi:hypothetical protein